MEQKLTQWFPSEVKPVHIGVYEVSRQNSHGRAFSRWDGEIWYFTHWTLLTPGGASEVINNAANEKLRFSKNLLFRWRGLAEPPK